MLPLFPRPVTDGRGAGAAGLGSWKKGRWVFNHPYGRSRRLSEDDPLPRLVAGVSEKGTLSEGAEEEDDDVRPSIPGSPAVGRRRSAARGSVEGSRCSVVQALGSL